MVEKKLPHIMVLGVGNEILQDEGVGIEVVKTLQSMKLPVNVEIVEGGTGGLDLLKLLEETDYLLIVDAVDARTQPGAIFRFKPDEVSVLPPEYGMSFHQLGLFEIFSMAKILGEMPDTTIFAIQPASMTWGIGLTPEVAAKVPVVIEQILEEIAGINERYSWAGT